MRRGQLVAQHYFHCENQIVARVRAPTAENVLRQLCEGSRQSQQSRQATRPNGCEFNVSASTQNTLWRLENGELDDVNPKVIVILAGTNNLNSRSAAGENVAGTTNGLRAIITLCQQKAPSAKIILTAIFPRNDHIDLLPRIDQINANIAKFADGKQIGFLNINDNLADKDGKLFDDVMVDKLHPTLKGYQIWADGLKPILTEILGPPATTDHAPPPTGDASAK